MPLSQNELLQLLLAHRAMLMGYVSLIVGDSHLAEDVFQEVALVVMNKGRAVTSAEGFPAWARTVARYKALNARKNRQRTPLALDEDLIDLLEDQWHAGDAAPPSAVPNALRECLERLSPQSRKLIELRYGHNLSGTALSERVGQQLNTVYVALSRIYRTLSNCVKLRLSREGLLYE